MLKNLDKYENTVDLNTYDSELEEILDKIEIEYNNNIDNLFKTKNLHSSPIQYNNQLPTEVTKINFFRKLINYIKDKIKS